MKSLSFLIVVLAALAACSDAAAVARRDNTSRSNLLQGNFKPGDKLLVSDYYYREPKKDLIQYLWVTYTGGKDLRFSYINVLEVGDTQWATPTITSGGVGYNNVTILMTSAQSKGFYFLVNIYGQ